MGGTHVFVHLSETVIKAFGFVMGKKYLVPDHVVYLLSKGNQNVSMGTGFVLKRATLGYLNVLPRLDHERTPISSTPPD